MLSKLTGFFSSILKKNGDMIVVDEFGDEIKQVKIFNGKVILSATTQVGTCRECGGPIFKDNKTSFLYACPNENVNKYVINK